MKTIGNMRILHGKAGFVETGYILVSTLVFSLLLFSSTLFIAQKASAQNPVSLDFSPAGCIDNKIKLLINWEPDSKQNALWIWWDGEVKETVNLSPTQGGHNTQVPGGKKITVDIGYFDFTNFTTYNHGEKDSPPCQNTPSPSAQPTPVGDFFPPNSLTENQFCEPNPDDKPVIVAFTWQGSPGAKSYRVYVEDKTSQDPSKNLLPGQLVHGTGDTWLDFPGDGNTQTWFVRAYATEDGNGNDPLADSPRKNFNTRTDCKNLQPPAVPQGLGVRASCDNLGQHTLTLFWNAVDGATGYGVAVMGDSGQLSQRDVPGTAVEIPPPPPDIKYSWKVKAYKDFQGQRLESAYTDTHEITPQIIDCPKPTPTPQPSPPPSPTPSPTVTVNDFSASVVSISPQSPVAGEKVTIRARYTNNGPEVRFVTHDTYSNSQSKPACQQVGDTTSTDGDKRFGTWAGNSETEMTYDFTAPQTPGTYLAWVVIDRDCQFAENNEENNYANITYVVSPKVEPTPTSTPTAEPSTQPSAVPIPSPTSSPEASIVPEICKKPGDFSPASPINLTDSPQPTFKWTKAEGTIRYILELSDDNFQTYWNVPVSAQAIEQQDGQSLVFQPWPASWSTNTSNGRPAPAQLEADKTYFWRSRALGDCLNPAQNTQAQTLSQTVAIKYQKPTGPRQIVPASLIHVEDSQQKGNSYGAIDVKFAWVPSSNSQELDQQWLYLKFAATDSPNHNNSVNIGPFDRNVFATEIKGDSNSPGLVPEKEYSWTIDTIDPQINYIPALAPPDKFKTIKLEEVEPSPTPTPKPGEEVCGNNIDDNNNNQIDDGCPPPKPNLKNPENGATLPDSSFDFAWDGSANTSYYWLDISEDPSFQNWWGCQTKETSISWSNCQWDSFLQSAGGADLGNAVPPASLPQGQYYWRIIAANDYDKSTSNTFKFAIGEVLPSPSPSPQPSEEPTPIPTPSPNPTPTPSSTPSPTAGATASPVASPSPKPSCELINASWSSDMTSEGRTVNLNLLGSLACNGKQITFRVFENDSVTEGLGDDDVKVQPQNTTFNGPNAQSSWIAEYQEDGVGGVFDPPEYYFIAYVGTNPTLTIKSSNPLLQVYKSCTLTSASWSHSEVEEGQQVTLNVAGNYACANQEVSFVVKENDNTFEGGGDDETRINPVSVKFPPIPNLDPKSGPIPPTISTSTIWMAEYQQDGPLGTFDPPEYYFEAQVRGQQDQQDKIRSSDPLLKVKKVIGGSISTPTPDVSPIGTPTSLPSTSPFISPAPSATSSASPTTNLPPNRPSKPQGPNTGQAGENLTFATSATDSDSPTLYFLIDFGDNTFTSSPVVQSQETYSFTYRWLSPGTYNLRAKAADPNDPENLQSDWSEPLTVTISGNSVTCTTVVNNGNPSQKLDITFVPVHYGSNEINFFSTDVSTAISDIIRYQPFSDKQNSINFHRIDLANFNPPDVFSYDVDKLAFLCPTDQIIVINNEQGFRGFALLGVGISAVGKFSLGVETGIVAHEFAHSFASLADEYVYEEAYGYIQDPSSSSLNCSLSQTSPPWQGYPQTSTFPGCSAKNYYRPSENSLMRVLYLTRTDAFDSWNIKLLSDKLRPYE